MAETCLQYLLFDDFHIREGKPRLRGFDWDYQEEWNKKRSAYDHKLKDEDTGSAFYDAVNDEDRGSAHDFIDYNAAN
jgi:hypothetical protein